MPLLRHAATPLLASTIQQQQHSLPWQPYFHLYYHYYYHGTSSSYSSQTCPHPRFPRQWRGAQKPPGQGQGQEQGRRRPFHTTSHLRDEQIDNAQNHYEALKLSPSATPAEVKKSFYALSKHHHPDVHPTSSRPAASRRFMRISEAYAILSVPAKRHAYDRDTLHLHASRGDHHHHHHHHHGRRPAGSYHSSSVSNSPAGGRPASGLSRRRGAFQGPPPSFYRSGGWGAHGTKRRAAHEDSTGSGSGSGSGYAESSGSASSSSSSSSSSSNNPGTGTGTGTGTVGGMGPGQDPFKSGHEDEVPPHFDRAGHERTGRRVDARRTARQQEQQHEHSHKAAMESERGMAGMFFVIGGVLLLSFLGPFAVGRAFGGGRGGGGGGGGGGERRKNKNKTT